MSTNKKRGERVFRVAFADEELRNSFEALKNGRFEERRLAERLQRAFDKLEENPKAGVAVPKSLWPTVYVKKYGIDNLRKLDLPEGWRLVYTLKGNEVEIIALVLEWFSHPGYAKRFGYKKR